jgi:hypothetical protein
MHSSLSANAQTVSYFSGNKKKDDFCLNLSPPQSPMGGMSGGGFEDPVLSVSPISPSNQSIISGFEQTEVFSPNSGGKQGNKIMGTTYNSLSSSMSIKHQSSQPSSSFRQFTTIPSPSDAFAHSFFMLHTIKDLIRPDSSAFPHHQTYTSPALLGTHHFSSDMPAFSSSYDLHIFPGPPPPSQEQPLEFMLGL